MTRADDLDILGLATDATDTEIRNAYRARALSHHPDLGGDAMVMASISDAYQRLIDPPAPPPTPPAARQTRSLDPDDLPDDFTIGHAMLAFLVIPVILTVLLMFGIFAVLSTIL